MGGEVKNMRGLLCAVVAAIVVVSGCGKAAAPPATSAGYKLYEAASTRSSQLVAVIDTRSHAVDRTLPWGILAGTHLYSITATTLSDIDPATGSTTRKLQLPGPFQLANGTVSGVPGGLSQSGRWLVLERAPGQPSSSTSQLLVVDTSVMKALAPITLTGNFQFDAISNDGQRLFLIDYLDGANYTVRVYDIPSGKLDPNIIVDKSDGTALMAGIRLSGVPSPDGQWLYSVYARHHKGAFIHALNLDGYAFCLDLPGSGYESSSDEFQWSLALSTDGSRLYAANGAKGIVAEVHAQGNNPPSVVRTVHIDKPTATSSMFVQNVEAKELTTGGLLLSLDGKTLVMAGQTGLLWIDTSTLRARSSHLAYWTVWSLGLSPDGTMVYALNNAGTIAELSMENPGTPTTFGASGAAPMALIRVDSSPAP
jgi:hypothetical protein